MAWRVFAAASLGASHREEGLPCQDAFASTREGEAVVAVVCDGAGSQPRSDIGAAWFSTRVVEAMAARLRASPALATAQEASVREAAAAAIGAARDALQAEAATQGQPLEAHAATLVGALLTPAGGWFFHVGDGLGIADGGETQAPCLSLPENGEYANETYFVTGGEWAAHLRLTPIAAGRTRLALMSDGAMPFVMARGQQGFFEAFMAPVTRFLADCASEDAGSAGLAATLGDPRTETITGDDKTLLVALWH